MTYREQEDVIDDKNTQIDFLRDLLKSNNITVPDEFEDIISEVNL